MTMGALSLTGCSAASTTPGAAAPPASGRTSAPSDSASSAETVPAPDAPTPGSDKAAASTGAAPREATQTPATDAPVEGATPGDAVSGATPGNPAAATAVAPAAPAAAAPVPAAPAAPVAAAAAAPAAPVAAAPAAPAAPVAAAAAAATAGDGTQAATTFGWGPVLAGDEFSNTGAPDATKWSVFKGAGHAGKGVRSPAAWSVANGSATVKGDTAGTTGGMSAKFAQQKYGRWETRMKTSARDPKYHPVVILWPNNNASANCAEIDYAEGSQDTTMMKFFLHYSCGGGSNFQTTAANPVDSTQWHNYAVEWTPAGITGFVDGKKTFTDTNPAHQPSVGMHQTLQLDWFPDGSATKASQMQVDWVRVYK
ncbi:family 16 glycosylhydrolase [Pseudarthrobacter sp. H2]|uniref:glycoside hydrolase family 16 protein n=1 Tax=Pseudarthrobacter sp. H2 TaxID=3418415 RepID=UPI003CF62B39